MRTLQLFIISILVLLALPGIVSAHAHVTPDESEPSQYQTFALTIPTEKQTPTIAIRLLIPQGVEKVSPYVKNGWQISLKKDAAGNVTEVEWSKGMIPVEQRDIFQFSARTPAKEGPLVWKVYQTYQDGTVVSWDQEPLKKDSMASPAAQQKESYPYAETKVVVKKMSDQKSGTSQSSQPAPDTRANTALILSILSLAASAFIVAKKS